MSGLGIDAIPGAWAALARRAAELVERWPVPPPRHASSRAGGAPPDRSEGGRGLKEGARARPVRCGVRAAASHNSLCAKL